MGGSGWRAVALAVLSWLAPSVQACAEPETLAYERIVLVTIDTLRADHLGLYGYPRPTSPFLDELAAGGVVFDRAYAPMPTTAPSHATIFTSLHPIQHGVRGNGMRLSPAVRTLAERFRDAGFHTAAFTSTHAQWLPTGLDRGFEHFDPRPKDSREVYRQAPVTVTAALAGLSRCGDCRRMLLFVHLFDPHAPLRPPDRHFEVFRNESAASRRRHVDYLSRAHGLPLAFFRNDPERALFIVDRYDAEIRFADEQLRRLYRRVSRLPGPTLWVVTADHGEGLGNHRFMGHGKAYEEGLRVPLLFHASDGSLSQRRVAGLVQHVDLAPTLLDLAGVAPQDPAEGRSLRPELEGGSGAARSGVFAQRGHIATGPAMRYLPEEDVGDLSGEQYAWIERRWKYLQHETGADELYDLEADPHETRNLLAEGAAPELERLRRALAEELAGLEARKAESAPTPSLDAETVEELRALGYLP